MPRRIVIETLLALASALLALGLAILALGVGPEQVGQRWLLGGDDQVLHYGIFASALDVLPFLPNPALGFPESQNLFFAPLFDPWSAFVVSAASPLLPDGVWALNLYNLAGFATVGFTSYLFFRALTVQRVTAFVFGQVFALAPYHFLQLGMGHPFLAAYWAVPLIGILVLMVAGDRTDPFRSLILAARTRAGRVLWRVGPIVVLGLAVAFTQSYYLVFGAIIVGLTWATSSCIALLQRRPLRTLLWPTVTLGVLALLIAIELAVLSLNLGDRYARYFGSRTPQDSELYGGKLIELLIPASTSGIPKVSSLDTLYRSATLIAPTTEPPGTSVIGVIAIVLALLVVALRVLGGWQGPSRTGMARLMRDTRVEVLSGAFLWALLFFLISGLGALLAFVSPEIRAWGRMSIVVSMLALGIAAVFVDRATRRIWVRALVLAALVAVAAVDQLAGIGRAVPLRPDPDTTLRSFVAEVDRSLPDECGIVQLPVKGFPETGRIGAMGDYDEMLPYLYAGDSDLRWSYGAVGGTRSADFWKDVEVEDFASRVRESGACAILVDTAAYESDAQWRAWVDEVTQADPVEVSTDDRRRFRLFTVPAAR